MSPRLGRDDAGEYDYRDRENPLNAGLVTVDPSAPAVGGKLLYLPTVMR